MTILVLNVGSSSVRHALFAHGGEQVLARGHAKAAGSAAVVAAVRSALARLPVPPTAVAHRVAHGGERLVEPVVVDAQVEHAIEAQVPFAPLHNPLSLLGIRVARERLPEAPQIAVFDTAFHATLPHHAFLYALPRSYYEVNGIRRYGFHGSSHQHMTEAAAHHLRADPERLRLVTCHLGSGASVAAIDHGRSVETSMGMTPLEGLVMQTRCGDVDPGVLVHLLRHGLTADALEELLERRSGLVGLSDVDGDVHAILEAAERGSEHARQAIAVFVHRLRKYIGGYVAVLGGVDALVFSGGVGEGSAQLRAEACATLGFLGVRLDEARNRDARPPEPGGVVDVSADDATVRVLVVHADEERVIARAAARLIARGLAGADAQGQLRG